MIAARLPEVDVPRSWNATSLVVAWESRRPRRGWGTIGDATGVDIHMIHRVDVARGEGKTLTTKTSAAVIGGKPVEV
jgi:hypothetical protein